MNKITTVIALIPFKLSIIIAFAIQLQPVSLAGAAAPLGQEKQEMVAPYFQDFNGVSVPDLPSGWLKIVHNPDYAQATVGTSSSFAPKSPPNHVRLLSNNSADQEVLLIAPAAADYTNKRIRFA